MHNWLGCPRSSQRAVCLQSHSSGGTNIRHFLFFWHIVSRLYPQLVCFFPPFHFLLSFSFFLSKVNISVSIIKVSWPWRFSQQPPQSEGNLCEISWRSEGEPLGTKACTLQSVMRLQLRAHARSFVHVWDNWQPKSQRGNVLRAQQTVTQTQGNTNYCRLPAKFTILQLHKAILV